MPAEPSLLSIGALSRATGVPADTLRTWERRYGFPAAERTESGHRRYSMLTLERLRRVTRALELGHRPGTVLTASDAQLDSLLSLARRAPVPAAGTTGATAEPRTQRMSHEAPEAINAWLAHVERFEGRAFDRELRTAYAELGGQAFLEERVGPFIVAVGERWASGALSVGHEHFASERLREYLAALWRPLSDAATGGAFVCATPPYEQHVLGLHMAALTIALANGRVVFLGANTPVAEIAAAVSAHAAEAVVLSASASCDRAQLRRDVAELRACVPASVPIVAGGEAFAAETPGAEVLPRFSALRAWLRSERPRPA
jgi:DNA-binding transcriptional MerR regulator